MYQDDYLFAKVGICADRHSWFGCPIPHAPAPFEPMTDASLSARKSRGLRMRDGASGERVPEYESGLQTAGKYRENWFVRRRKMRERQRELRRQQQEYVQKLQEYKERQEELTDSIRQLWKEVFSEVERAGGAGEVRCVYEESLRFLAEGRGEAAICWSPVWNIPEFRDYKSMRWLRPLLEYVRHSDFILLGAADCIPAILQELARRMKSLQWYLREEDLSEEVQDWVEDFYEEYGLAITLRKLTGENAFSQLRLKAGEDGVRDTLAFHTAIRSPQQEDNPEPQETQAPDQQTFYENEDTQVDFGGDLLTWAKPLSTFLILLLLAAVLFGPSIASDRLKKRRARNRQGLDDPDNSVAIQAAFLYALRWLKLGGVTLTNVPFSQYAPQVGQAVSPALQTRYEQMLPLWQEAAYSGHAMDSAQRDAMLDFAEEVRQAVWTQLGKKERFRAKYIDAL